MQSEYDYYLEHDFSSYAGQWVLIRGQKIVSAGTNLKEILRQFKKDHPQERPFVAKIPKKITMII